MFKRWKLKFLMIFGCLTLLFLLGVAVFKAVQADQLRQIHKTMVPSTVTWTNADDAGKNRFVCVLLTTSVIYNLSIMLQGGAGHTLFKSER